jgi:hypothetical protein
MRGTVWFGSSPTTDGIELEAGVREAERSELEGENGTREPEVVFVLSAPGLDIGRPVELEVSCPAGVEGLGTLLMRPEVPGAALGNVLEAGPTWVLPPTEDGVLPMPGMLLVCVGWFLQPCPCDTFPGATVGAG